MLALLLSTFAAVAQTRTVAITVDDLPSDMSTTRRLLAAFRRHHTPVTGFVIDSQVTNPAILKLWLAQGFDLANHSYSHPDFNTLSIPEIEAEITNGERTLSPLLQQAGKRLNFFRFPMNHTGDTQARHDAIAAFLAARGYRVATCTIENSDYLFNPAYLKMLATHDRASAQKLRAAYLLYTAAEIDYYAALDKKIFGYEPPEVMLLHDNPLNAEMLNQILHLFEARHYRFVSLAEAQSDPAYRTPDTDITKFGPMWGYRWARVRHVQFNGRLEPEPPQWILDYAKSH